ncbi:MAG TPA: hypothetical protein VF530_21540 [Planctomycetota bacterium]
MDPRPDTLEPVPPLGRHMRVLSRDRLLRSLSQAVEETLLEFSALPPAARQTLRRAIERRFEGTTLARARRVRGLTRAEALLEFERAHSALGKEHAEARRELAELEQRLREAQAAAPHADLELDTAAHAQALTADLEELLRAPDPHAALARVVEREAERRAQAVARAQAEERDKADVLERRLAKMRAELATMERAMAALERRAAQDDGVASIYKDVQGLADGEAEREVKRELMRQIFEANVAIQLRAGQAG